MAVLEFTDKGLTVVVAQDLLPMVPAAVEVQEEQQALVEFL